MDNELSDMKTARDENTFMSQLGMLCKEMDPVIKELKEACELLKSTHSKWLAAQKKTN